MAEQTEKTASNPFVGKTAEELEAFGRTLDPPIELDRRRKAEDLAGQLVAHMKAHNISPPPDVDPDGLGEQVQATAEPGSGADPKEKGSKSGDKKGETKSSLRPALRGAVKEARAIAEAVKPPPPSTMYLSPKERSLRVALHARSEALAETLEALG